MSTHGGTQCTIRDFIVEDLLDGQPVEEGENLLLSGLIDSVGVMRLIAFLEGKFSIKIPPEDVTIENMATITSIAAYVERDD